MFYIKKYGLYYTFVDDYFLCNTVFIYVLCLFMLRLRNLKALLQIKFVLIKITCEQ